MMFTQISYESSMSTVADTGKSHPCADHGLRLSPERADSSSTRPSCACGTASRSEKGPAPLRPAYRHAFRRAAPARRHPAVTKQNSAKIFAPTTGSPVSPVCAMAEPEGAGDVSKTDPQTGARKGKGTWPDSDGSWKGHIPMVFLNHSWVKHIRCCFAVPFIAKTLGVNGFRMATPWQVPRSEGVRDGSSLTNSFHPARGPEHPAFRNPDTAIPV